MGLPRSFGMWLLLDSNVILTGYSLVGEMRVTVNGSDRVWRIGRSEDSLHLYLFTDLPHPDAVGRECDATYLLDPEEAFDQAAKKLCAAMKEASDD